MLQRIATYTADMYLKTGVTYTFLILNAYVSYGHTTFTWVRMWGSVVILRSQQDLQAKMLLKHCPILFGFNILSHKAHILFFHSRQERNFFAWKHPDRRWGLVSLLFNGYRGHQDGRQLLVIHARLLEAEFSIGNLCPRRARITCPFAGLLFQQMCLYNVNWVSSITKNFLCVTHTAEHNYISPSSTVGIQLHVSALYVGHLQVVI